MLPLSTTLTGTSVFRAKRKPKKNPKTAITIIAMAIADFKYSLWEVFALLKALPSIIKLYRKEFLTYKQHSFRCYRKLQSILSDSTLKGLGAWLGLAGTRNSSL